MLRIFPSAPGCSSSASRQAPVKRFVGARSRSFDCATERTPPIANNRLRMPIESSFLIQTPRTTHSPRYYLKLFERVSNRADFLPDSAGMVEFATFGCRLVAHRPGKAVG